MVADKGRKSSIGGKKTRKSLRGSSQKKLNLRTTPPKSCYRCPVCPKEYQSRSGYLYHKCTSGHGIKKKKVLVKRSKHKQSSRKIRQPLEPDEGNVRDRSSSPSPSSNGEPLVKPFECKKCLERFEHRFAYIRHEKNSKCMTDEPLSLDSLINEIHNDYLERNE